MTGPSPGPASPGAIRHQDALDDALARLHVLDPATVDHLLAVGGPPPLRLREPGFAGLAAIVMGQQLSTASAAAIFGRLEAAVAPLKAEAFLRADDGLLRTIGLSASKVLSLRAAAQAVVEGRLDLETVGGDIEVLRASLLAVRGIGPWTADCFLLFCLGHPDAWPAGDLALQEAARVALRLQARPGALALERLGDRWRPYRGVAARLLWAYYRAIKHGRSGMPLADPEESLPP